MKDITGKRMGVGDDKTYESDEKQDEMDALSLYETLEDQIVPIYYSNRSENGVPTTWMRWVKEAIRTLSPQFSTRRMVGDYVREMYIPAIRNPRNKTDRDRQTDSGCFESIFFRTVNYPLFVNQTG